jgi:hypothetical protein
MLAIGTIIKYQTADFGVIFYRITGISKTAYTILPLCRVRKGYLTNQYHQTAESDIFKSEVGIQYLPATPKELAQIKAIITQTGSS